MTSRLCGSAILALLLAIAAAPLAAMDGNEEMSPAHKEAVERGLAWLAANQRADGTWPGGGNQVGLVAACATALMTHGHLPGSGKHGVTTARALQYLLRNAQPDGLLFRQGAGEHPMYHHGLATLALAEAWGQTGDRKLREALRKAVDLICATQNEKGGWRYQPKIADDDLSVTVMQLMALRAAKDAGMEVPKEVIDAGIEYVKKCHNGKSQGKDGGFAYRFTGESGPARTGAGVTSLQYAGNYRAAEVSEGVEYLLRFQPVGKEKPDGSHYWYYVYYGSLGMFHAQSIGPYGKQAWEKWYPAMVADILARQKGGRWDGGHEPYPTAVALIVLGIPCRSLPILQL